MKQFTVLETDHIILLHSLIVLFGITFTAHFPTSFTVIVLPLSFTTITHLTIMPHAVW